MPEYLTKERENELYAKYGANANDTGSIKAQVAVMTERIKGLSDHLQKNQKDQQCRRALLSMVGKRKRFLNYIAKKDIIQYRELIADLGIRK